MRKIFKFLSFAKNRLNPSQKPWAILPKWGTRATIQALREGELGFCIDTHELFVGTKEGNFLIGISPTGTFYIWE